MLADGLRLPPREALLLAVAASVGCGSPKPPDPERPMPPPPAPAAELPPAAQDPALEALVAEMRRAKDVNHWALAMDQSPPPHFVRFSRKAGLPQKYDRVVAYVLNYGRGSFVHRGVEQPGCGGAVAPDGTLCPTVVLPGVELSAAQAGRLAQLAGVEPSVPRTSTCAGRAHHSFVFYDPAGTPVFEYLLDLYCGRDSLAESDLGNETRADLAALCRDIGVGLCFLGERVALEAANQAFADRYVEELPNGAKQLLPVPLDISGDRSLSSLTATERRRLCAWNIEHSINWLEPGGDPRLNEAGAQMRLQDFVECTERFPECPARLGEILPCMSDAQRGAPVHTSFSDATCLERAECLWGFAFSGARRSR